MGDRANYAIREGGVVELFYSHWGATTIAEDIFWGPKRTEAFVRGNKADQAWLNSVWAQGGVALDKDQLCLTYYYYEWPDEDDLRRVYVELLESNWKGWAVRRATGWGDIAEAVGVPRENVTAPPSPHYAIPINRLGENLKKGQGWGLLSVKAGGAWDDRAIDFVMAGVLMNGPMLLDRVAGIATLEDLRSAFDHKAADDPAFRVGDWLQDFCAIDIEARTIRLSVPFYDEDELPFLADVWPGWRITTTLDGSIAEHFTVTGREVLPELVPSPKKPGPSLPDRPHHECVRLIMERLDGNEKKKDLAIEGMLGVVRRLEAESQGPVTVTPAAMIRTAAAQSGFLGWWQLRLTWLRGRLIRR